MTTTSAVAGAQNANTAASASKDKPESTASNISSDFDTFLKLLTAQLKSQDPLSPLDATQFVEQLATFSSVEQQLQTNKLLGQLVDSSSGSGLDSASQWIGKQVEAPTSDIQYSGAPLNFKVDTAAEGTPTEVIIKNVNGDVVAQKTLGAGQTAFTFDGLDDNNAPLPNAQYSLEVNYETDGKVTDTKPLTGVANVMEARLSDGSVSLLLDNGALIDPGAVTTVR